jgi:histidyl-tRNA synthetase
MGSIDLHAVKGMNDILPTECVQWEYIEAQVRGVMQRFGYQGIRTPIVESIGVFIRGLGQVTDIVEKEMYSFTDHLNGDVLCLRPENTAGVVRAAIEHNLLYEGGKRLYYLGPMFRHERPQRGRYRQFHQIGAEALGFSGPAMDVELILLADSLWRVLGLQDVCLEINTLGQSEERQAHRQALITYFEQHIHVLDEQAAARLHTNPLRLLDSKNPRMQEVIEAAPRLLDFLGSQSLAHFEQVQNLLKACGIAFRINPRLVRGMDYYNLTVFEFTTPHLGAQATICGGGRYDGLVGLMGGKPTPAVGFALGVERVLDLLKQQSVSFPCVYPTVYVVLQNDAVVSLALPAIQILRELGLRVQVHPHPNDSLKTQFKKANASGARFALIFGEAEAARGQVAIKDLRTEGQVVAQAEYALVHLKEWATILLAEQVA